MERRIWVIIASFCISAYGERPADFFSLMVDPATGTITSEGSHQPAEFTIIRGGETVSLIDPEGMYHTLGIRGHFESEIALPAGEYLSRFQFTQLKPIFGEKDSVSVRVGGNVYTVYPAYWQQRINDFSVIVSSTGEPVRIEFECPLSGVVLSGISIRTPETSVSKRSEERTFIAEDRLKSVLLSWSPFPSGTVESIVILRSESLAGPFQPIAHLPGNYSYWTDWEVEQRHVYFYRLAWRDVSGREEETRTDTPPFATPLALPGHLNRVNLEISGEMSVGASEKFKSQENPVVGVTMGDETYTGTSIETGTISVDIQFGRENGRVYEISPAESELDLFTTFVVLPLLGWCQEGEAELVWATMEEKALGLFMLYPKFDPNDVEVVNELDQMFVRELVKLDPLSYQVDFATDESLTGFSFTDLPFSDLISLNNHFKRLLADDSVSGLVGTFESARQLFGISPSSQGKTSFGSDRNVVSDVESVISRWVRAMNNALSILGKESLLRVSEVSLGDREDEAWVELMAVGEEPLLASDYTLTIDDSGSVEFGKLELLPGEVFIRPLPFRSHVSQDSLKNGLKLSIRRKESGEAVDSFWMPFVVKQGSLGRLVSGDFFLFNEPTPGLVNDDLIKPEVFINEYSVVRNLASTIPRDIDNVQVKEEHGATLRLELFLPELENIPFLDLRLVIDFDKGESIVVRNLDPTRHYQEFPVDVRGGTNHLVVLERFDNTAGWVNEQVISIGATEESHWSRIPDGGVWQSVAHRTFGETNVIGNEKTSEPGIVPEVFALYQNYPNPFNVVTTIKFDLLEDAVVTLVVVDATGREVSEFLRDKPLPAGHYSFQWKGEHLSSGIYFFTLTAVAGNYVPVVDSRKMIYLK